MSESTLALVSLTPAESKKLIAKALAETDAIKNARMVVMHPSSSTYFLAEALTGRPPKTNVWVCGAIIPKGLCGEMGTHGGQAHLSSDGEQLPGPSGFTACWVFRDGKITTGTPLVKLLNELGPDDVYVKGVNAVDPKGNVGVLIGNLTEGGTIGLVVSKWRERGFNLFFPVGLEKLIPCTIEEAAAEAKRERYSYCMGVPSYLLGCPPDGQRCRVVTELKAIEMLSGAKAIPVAAGGLGGAEGSIALVIKGEVPKVSKAIEYIEAAKGAELPPFRVSSCFDCSNTFCKSRLHEKPWVKTF